MLGPSRPTFVSLDRSASPDTTREIFYIELFDTDLQLLLQGEQIVCAPPHDAFPYVTLIHYEQSVQRGTFPANTPYQIRDMAGRQNIWVAVTDDECKRLTGGDRVTKKMGPEISRVGFVDIRRI